MKAPTMGMDVYGRKPSAEIGKYFRNNVWYWRPLAELCQHFAPDVCAACKYWQSNDGDGLDAAGAVALAKVLKAKLDDGTIARHLAERDKWIASLPDETCRLCKGTGKRCDEYVKGTCNACDGTGKVRPSITHYPCDVENVTEFAAFLEASGGFSIN